MDAAALRNFKDFLLIYNKMTENCFSQCASTLTDRERSEKEIACVDSCAQKHINVNHKIMKLYMDIQPEFMNRKLEEASKLQELSESSESKGSSNELLPVPAEISK